MEIYTAAEAEPQQLIVETTRAIEANALIDSGWYYIAKITDKGVYILRKRRTKLEKVNA